MKMPEDAPEDVYRKLKKYIFYKNHLHFEIKKTKPARKDSITAMGTFFCLWLW